MSLKQGGKSLYTIRHCLADILYKSKMYMKMCTEETNVFLLWWNGKSVDQLTDSLSRAIEWYLSTVVRICWTYFHYKLEEWLMTLILTSVCKEESYSTAFKRELTTRSPNEVSGFDCDVWKLKTRCWHWCRVVPTVSRHWVIVIPPNSILTHWLYLIGNHKPLQLRLIYIT